MFLFPGLWVSSVNFKLSLLQLGGIALSLFCLICKLLVWLQLYISCSDKRTKQTTFYLVIVTERSEMANGQPFYCTLFIIYFKLRNYSPIKFNVSYRNFGLCDYVDPVTIIQCTWMKMYDINEESHVTSHLLCISLLEYFSVTRSCICCFSRLATRQLCTDKNLQGGMIQVCIQHSGSCWWLNCSSVLNFKSFSR